MPWAVTGENGIDPRYPDHYRMLTLLGVMAPREAGTLEAVAFRPNVCAFGVQWSTAKDSLLAKSER
jgi:hypothetical protein